METETKTPRALIGIVIILVLGILGSGYYWYTQKTESEMTPRTSDVPPQITEPAPVVTTTVKETTPEEDLSVDVLDGIDTNLSSGISN